jgi:superfamily II DNA or RNA helicase
MFDFIDSRPTQFPYINFTSNITLKDHMQETAFNAFMSADSGVLNLNTGKGKTVLTLKKIETDKIPSLIIVHNTFLKDQWLTRIKDFGMDSYGVGLIQGNIMDWKKPIVIGLIETIANRVESGLLPIEMQQWFGSVYYDEVHHLAAPVFSKSAACVLGKRYGLSATPKRADGLDCIVKYHLGDVFYSDMSYDLMPDVFIIETDTKIKIRSWDTIFSMITSVSINIEGLELRYKLLKRLSDQGRNVLAISARKEELITLHAQFPDSNLLIGKSDKNQRVESVKNSRMNFVIRGLGLEGLDNKEIDTIVFLSAIGGDKTITENGTEFLGNQIRQGLGRILRDSGKVKVPQAYFFDEINVEPLHMLCGQVKNFLVKNGFGFKVLKGEEIESRE